MSKGNQLKRLQVVPSRYAAFVLLLMEKLGKEGAGFEGRKLFERRRY